MTTLADATNPNDGVLSLREAIAASVNDDVINFSVTGTITLTSGELPLGRNLTIAGPDAASLTVSGNHASRVFNISSGITVNISNLTISSANGGGIYNNGGILTVDNCTIAGNSAGGGGGIFNQGSLTINNCTIAGNSAGSGGGIFNQGSLTINNCTIAGNSASFSGGGIFNQGSLTINNCTIAGNSASFGGGISSHSGLIILNTIIANNTDSFVSPDVAGAVSSLGHNLIGQTGGSSGWIVSDLTGSNASPLDPNLGPLQNNGGPTPTLALLPTSAAIDAGDDAVLGPPYNLSTDQRRQPRRVGDHVDIGAYEFGSITRLVTTLNDSGGGSLRHALSNALDSDRILFAPVVTGKIRLTTGELNVNVPLTIIGPGAATLAISGSNNSRVFHVGPQGNVDIYSLTITEGRVVGANGAPGTFDINDNLLPGFPGEQGIGGGILNEGALSLYDCMVTSNSVTGGNGGRGGNGLFGGIVEDTRATAGGAGGGGLGAGIYSAGSLGLFRCTVLGNSGFGGTGGNGGNNPPQLGVGPAGGAGGAARGNGVFAGVMATLENCTFAGNRSVAGGGGNGGPGSSTGPGGAGGTAGGGALSGAFTLQSCTVSGNSIAGGAGGTGGSAGTSGPALGGGVNSTSLDLLNTLISGNTGSASSPDIAGTVSSQGWNLIGITDGSSGWTVNDFLGNSTFPLPALLSPCQDNGGPVWTMCLLTNSPARDKGRSDLATDARGGIRIVDFPNIPNASGGDGSDIGALEVDSMFRILSITKSNTFARVRFKSDPGNIYTLQQTSVVTNRAWTNVVGAVVTGTGQNLEATDSGPLPPTRFYRVRAE